MKILFLTTYNVTWNHEHFFTRNVSKGLLKMCRKEGHELLVSTLIEDTPDDENWRMKDSEGNPFPTNPINVVKGADTNQKIEALRTYFSKIRPDIIHSQMIEGYDIKAAKSLNIPIVNTIHIGGIICPRGGGDGFLRHDDSICNQPIGKECSHCMAIEMPFPKITYLLHKLTPHKFKVRIRRKLPKPVFYLTRFLDLAVYPESKKKFIELAKYSHLICANYKLIDLLKLNGLRDNLHLIPHGVQPRRRLELPSLEGPVKFYFLGRAQRSKGLHNVLKALKGIPANLYELHVLGSAKDMGKKDHAYYNQLKQETKDLNVFFEGRIPNADLENKIKDYHVMIHPAIFHEIYGIAIAESLSMGRPVLATRCGGAEMQVKNGKNGWLVPPNDVETLRKGIYHIINNKAEIREFANNAKLPMGIDEYSKRLIQLYSEIINNTSSISQKA